MNNEYTVFSRQTAKLKVFQNISRLNHSIIIQSSILYKGLRAHCYCESVQPPSPFLSLIKTKSHSKCFKLQIHLQILNFDTILLNEKLKS